MATAFRLSRLAFIGCLLVGLITVSGSVASQNPVPFINQPLVPDAVKPGGAGFLLTVNGSGFAPGAVVKWNGQARTTTFVHSSRLTADILQSDITRPCTAAVTVINPGTGGASSNVVFLHVTTPAVAIPGLAKTVNPSTGQFPISIAVGDFNKDGKLDMAVANYNSNDVTILLGNGNGKFQPGVNYSVDSNPYSVAVGDVNGDGNLDLAVANSGSNNVSVLLGKGDGSFEAALNYGTGSGSTPLSAAFGDFNRDGKLDLVVANFGTNNVSVLLGNGDGTFQTPEQYTVGTSPRSVAVGDFNQDGNLDLAVANWVSGSVSVLLGKGDGTFASAVNHAVGSAPYWVAVADFNGDTKLDLAVANVGSDNVSVLLGNGDGSFQASVNYGVGGQANDVVVGDFNGDSKPDLLVEEGDISVLLGKGNGSFQAPITYAGGAGGVAPVQLAVGDFNGDGRLDLAVTGSVVSVLLQGTIAPSKTSVTFPVQVVGTTSVAQSVTITNIGPFSLSIGGIAITGADATDFGQSHTCGTTLGPGASCSISVTFKPSTIGPRNASITITDNGIGSPQSIPVRGIGAVSGPNATLAPTSLSFRCAFMCVPPPCGCRCTAPQTTTLDNFGSTTLSVSSITTTTPFSETHTCASSLAPGTSCSITVSFHAREKGNYTDAISVTDNAPGSPQIVSLTGTSTCP
jgi:hypothetical protein